VIMMEIVTSRQIEIVDITDGIERYVNDCGREKGICLVYSLHTTTALIINEADEALLNDILKLMERIAPQAAGYQHDRGDGNAHAHLRTALLGNSVIIPVENGGLALGTWQRILFIEMDGPRKRRLSIRIIGD
ncbi:MAG: secondary thiamine-phosphate synthase enzyme YjbQ, partial [Methanothrix sp.]